MPDSRLTFTLATPDATLAARALAAHAEGLLLLATYYRAVACLQTLAADMEREAYRANVLASHLDLASGEVARG